MASRHCFCRDVKIQRKFSVSPQLGPSCVMCHVSRDVTCHAASLSVSSRDNVTSDREWGDNETSAKYLETNIQRNNNIQELQCENMLRARWLKNGTCCPGILGVLKSISKLMMYHFIRLTITHKIYILHQSRQHFEDKFCIHVKAVISL